MIVTTERDFRTLVTSQLNSAAYVAEKVNADDLEEALNKLQFDKSIQNIVVDGASFPEKGIIDFLKGFWNGIDKERAYIVLVALSEDQKGFKEVLDKAFGKVYFRVKPLEIRTFNEVFHQGTPINQGAGVKVVDSEPKPAVTAESKAAAPQSDEKKALVAFFEASNHAKDTIDFINTVAKDFTAVDKFIEAGNRFNGIMGTFAFLKHKGGYAQLHSLSHMIDTVTRTYELENWQEVSQEHFDFVLRSAKCAFLILKECREGRGPTASQIEETSAIEEVFAQFTGLKQRSSQSQDEVDDLLAQLDNAS